MKKRTLFILAMAIMMVNAAWSQCEPGAKRAKPNSLFVNNGGAGPYIKTGQAIYAGIMVDDNDGKPKVALVNETCSGLFEKGDLIHTLNNTTIKSAKDWEKALKQYKKGDKVKITIERAEKQLTVDVILDTIDVYKSVI